MTTQAPPVLGEGEGAPQDRPLCDSCGKAPSKYCCPGCSRRSCSLECVKAHKEATGCNGKRDRTAFVGRGQWDERHLLSDYRFLEDVKLADDVAKRSRPPAPKQELPPFLQTLIQQARRRGVQLHILAPGMAKRVHNSTRFDIRQKLLRWHVEWHFVAAGCKVTDQRVHENTKLSQVLRSHLELQPGAALKHHTLRQYVEAAQQAQQAQQEGGSQAAQHGTGPQPAQQPAQQAQQQGVEGLVVLMRKERTPANAPEYYRIDLNQVLSKQLAGKVVVEYPTFLVLLPGEEAQYKIVVPQQPAQQGQPQGQQRVQQGPASGQQQQQQQQERQQAQQAGDAAAPGQQAAAAVQPPLQEQQQQQQQIAEHTGPAVQPPSEPTEAQAAQQAPVGVAQQQQAGTPSAGAAAANGDPVGASGGAAAMPTAAAAVPGE